VRLLLGECVALVAFSPHCTPDRAVGGPVLRGALVYDPSFERLIEVTDRVNKFLQRGEDLADIRLLYQRDTDPAQTETATAFASALRSLNRPVSSDPITSRIALPWAAVTGQLGVRCGGLDGGQGQVRK
jgi:hypothetical protein